MVRFTWDARKSETNLQVRGFDFAVASRIFGGPFVEWRDRRRDYGEERMIAIGLANDIELTVGIRIDRRSPEPLNAGSFRLGGAIDVSGKNTGRRSKRVREAPPTRGRADWERLRRMSDEEIERTSPPELANLPDDFWDGARTVHPDPKVPISLRVDRDVLEWFRRQGPRYQSRMNAVLRVYMEARKKR